MNSPTKMISTKFLLIITICFPCFETLDYGLVYMETSCGTTISLTKSFQMDSATGITYPNSMNCKVTVTAPSGHFVVAHITRFELEAAWTGTCTDYIEVYDGTSLSSPKLNSDLICGTGSSIPSNFTSTGESITLQMITDSSGVYVGFNIVFVAATNPLCSVDQLTCNSSICIPADLDCDGYDQCGDLTDEQNCDAKVESSGLNVLMVVLITLVALLVIGAVVAVLVYRHYVRNKWRKFVNSQMDDDDEIFAPGPSYPITHKYYKGLRGHPVYFTNAAQADEKKENVVT